MKKKLDDLNRKIRHSRKKQVGLIHKQNSLRRAIEELKHGTKPEPEPEQCFIQARSTPFMELIGVIGLIEDLG